MHKCATFRYVLPFTSNAFRLQPRACNRLASWKASAHHGLLLGWALALCSRRGRGQLSSLSRQPNRASRIPAPTLTLLGDGPCSRSCAQAPRVEPPVMNCTNRACKGACCACLPCKSNLGPSSPPPSLALGLVGLATPLPSLGLNSALRLCSRAEAVGEGVSPVVMGRWSLGGLGLPQQLWQCRCSATGVAATAAAAAAAAAAGRSSRALQLVF